MNFEEINKERIRLLDLTGGMTPTILDHFAGIAFGRLLNIHGDVSRIVDNDGWCSIYLRAYEHAEQMLKERERVLSTNH